MKTVRVIATFLKYLSRLAGSLILLIAFYAAIILIVSKFTSWQMPVEIKDGAFTIFYPFTKTAFLLGDYTTSYIVSNLITFYFYGLFLLWLGGVFQAFSQKKLFTSTGVKRLTRFYMINIVGSVLFLLILLFMNSDPADLLRIILLHLVIGIFAFFMAAIFKQGYILQEEQDLTF